MSEMPSCEAIVNELRDEALKYPDTGWLSDLARRDLRWDGQNEIIIIGSWYGSVDVGHLAAIVESLIDKKTQDLTTRLEQAEARVKLLESGIVADLVVTSVHSARSIGAAVSGISEALLKLGYDGLTERLEQAEQDRVKLRNRLDAMRRQRDGYQNQLRKAEQQVARVRELCRISEEHAQEYGDTASVYVDDLKHALRALDGDTRG